MNVTAFLAAVIGIAVAVLGAVLLIRSRKQQVRAEVDHAADVLTRFPPLGRTAFPGARETTLDPDAEELPREPVEFADLAWTARQEAEIYLKHHQLALQHHAAYQQASLWAGVLGFALVLVGGVLTYVAGLDVGIVTAVAGAIPSVASGLLFRQANLVADRAAANLSGLETSVRRFNALQAAKSVADQIGDVPTRNRLYELIGRHLLFPDEDLAELQKRLKK